MWLLTTFVAAIIASAAGLILKNRYNLRFLSLMLWGGTIMILVDHIIGYRGGAFFEARTEGIIGNSTVLGLAMLIPVIFIWLLSIFTGKNKIAE